MTSRSCEGLAWVIHRTEASYGDQCPSSLTSIAFSSAEWDPPSFRGGSTPPSWRPEKVYCPGGYGGGSTGALSVWIASSEGSFNFDVLPLQV